MLEAIRPCLDINLSSINTSIVPLDFIKERKDTLVPMILMVVGMGTLAYNSVAGAEDRLNPFSKTIKTIIDYPAGVVDGAADSVGNTWHNYAGLRYAQKEKVELEKSVERLEWKLMKLTEEVALMRMGLVPTIWPGAELISARIIGHSPQDEYRIVTINRGSSSGIGYGMPVVVGAGTVGKIIGGGASNTVPSGSATVLLLTDPRCRVDALIYRFKSFEEATQEEAETLDPECPWNPKNWKQTRTRGVVQGDFDHLKLKFVSRDADIRPGDMVVSSGMGGVFPKGLRLGKVSVVVPPAVGLSPRVEVIPLVDFESLEEVQIMVQKGAPAP